MAKKLELSERRVFIPRWRSFAGLRIGGQPGERMDWARILAFITGTADQELLLRNEYLAVENRILRGQLSGGDAKLIASHLTKNHGDMTKRYRRRSAAQLTVCKKLQATRRFGGAEFFGFLVPGSRLAYVRARAEDTDRVKHDRIIGCAHCQCRGRIARFRRALKYEPGGCQIPSRRKLFALFHEELDFLGIEPADGFAGRWCLDATWTSRQHRHRIALGRRFALRSARPLGRPRALRIRSLRRCCALG
jgi:hypothetical protein